MSTMGSFNANRLDPVEILRRVQQVLSLEVQRSPECAMLQADIGVLLADVTGQARRLGLLDKLAAQTELNASHSRPAAASDPRGWSDAATLAAALCEQSAAMHRAMGESEAARGVLLCADLIRGRLLSGREAVSGQSELLEAAKRLRELARTRIEWRIADPRTGSYAVAFSGEAYPDPERQARQWLAHHREAYPSGRFVDHEVVRTEVRQELDAAAIDAAQVLQAAACQIARQIQGNRAQDSGRAAVAVVGGGRQAHQSTQAQASCSDCDLEEMQQRITALVDAELAEQAATLLREASSVLDSVRRDVSFDAWKRFGLRDFLPDELDGAAVMLTEGATSHELLQIADLADECAGVIDKVLRAASGDACTRQGPKLGSSGEINEDLCGLAIMLREMSEARAAQVAPIRESMPRQRAA